MKKLILIVCFALVFTVYGKEGGEAKKDFIKAKLIAGENILDYNQQKFQLFQEAKQQSKEDPRYEQKRKSGFKAALFSAVIPGAGEIYAESYWRSAIFAVVEIVAWAGYFTYDDKGDTKDIQMRRLGDQEWSEQRYWTKVYLLAGDSWNGSNVSLNSDGLLSEADIEANQSYLRALEAGSTPEIPNGFTRFTHTLPETKTQQYYEMIYKYLGQFGAGWKELGDNWSYYDGGANLNNLSPDVERYRSLRNKSNDFYTTAKAMSTIVLFNHLASAFDAALSVKSYNQQLSYSIYAGQKRYAGERVTTYGIALSW
jgi:hypothetical protein